MIIQVLQRSVVTHLRQGGRFYYQFLLQFTSECKRERTIKIGQSLPKLAQIVCMGVFLTRGV